MDGSALGSESIRQFDYGAVFLMAVTIMVFLVPIFTIFPPVPVEPGDALRQTHYKLGRPSHQSNLDHHHTSDQQPQTGTKPTVKSLFIYPIKSCRGIELDRSRVLPTGLEHDRLFMFAQRKPTAAHSGTHAGPRYSWEAVTQRQLPLLANINVDVWLPDASKTSRQLGHLDDKFLLVRFPWQAPGWRGNMHLLATKLSRGWRAVPEKQFLLPMDFPSQTEMEARSYEFEHVKIWTDVSRALNMSKDLPPQLATYLGAKHQLALFRSDPSSRRKVFGCAPRKETLGYQPEVDFHDGYPIHLLNMSSIHALESLIQKDESIQSLNARRFRGNIIVSGAEEYDEDEWKSVRFRSSSRPGESSQFDVSCRTVRCKLPNVDPATGVRHGVEPDRSLRKYRVVDEGAPRMGCLGMQLCPVFPDASTPARLESYVQVGMGVEVLERGPHKYLKEST
ncbi:hypothetical protein E4U42_003103 [Claviceps africana]|uniref:MOSC domain-containing protein n=1 Tax=Claviceps africana TaxID=83212 RepID=A0A8K0J797_9HYPO|nr:hypothetical protein E4U42_003103 [Claviceps africana]